MRLREDVVELMEALGAVRPQLWKGRGGSCWGRWPMCVDGTHEGRDGHVLQGRVGVPPADHSLANTGSSLVNRPGNVPRVEPGGAASSCACAGTRTAFSLTAHFDEWSEKADFIFGYRSCGLGRGILAN